ncbi:MAG TPA: thiamine pyrophosphate-dependent enzyme [Thermodesulfobacteriota bacterium]|nr:thiamine pyrophosphate-dependent enzyme [Thermodesulfobacteriota bacterium]
MNPIGEKYLRKNFLPFIFCPGCGDGMIVQAFLKAVDEMGIIDDLALAAGIGCSAWIPCYIHADVLKILHGRAIPAAIGIKASKPSRKVVVFTGDGDGLAIGGNHLLHAARRNMDITVIVVNNQIYAMTGGQVAPSTQVGARTQTTPYGNLEKPLDGCKVAMACGATMVSRWSTAQPKVLTRTFKAAMEHKGFSFIEVISQCPVQTGRYILGSGAPQFNLQWIKEHCVPVDHPSKMEAVEAEGKIPLGDFVKIEKPEYMEEVLKMNKKLKEASSTN